MDRTSFSLVITGVLLNAVAQLCLKAATRGGGAIAVGGSEMLAGLWRISMAPWFWVGCLCYGLSLIIWVLALSRVPVSIAYPMLSLGYVVNAAVAYFWLGEALGLQKILAIAIIIVGIGLLVQQQS